MGRLGERNGDFGTSTPFSAAVISVWRRQTAQCRVSCGFWWRWENNIRWHRTSESKRVEHLQYEFLLRAGEIFSPEPKCVLATQFDIDTCQPAPRRSWVGDFCRMPADGSFGDNMRGLLCILEVAIRVSAIIKS